MWSKALDVIASVVGSGPTTVGTTRISSSSRTATKARALRGRVRRVGF